MRGVAESSEDALATVEAKIRRTLDTVRARAEERLQRISRSIVRRPVRALGIAFGVGLVLARLLQKLD
jgi:ElaB/YqjD/DUF883 family membrane-anchored ribosome-binding protein